MADLSDIQPPVRYTLVLKDREADAELAEFDAERIAQILEEATESNEREKREERRLREERRVHEAAERLRKHSPDPRGFLSAMDADRQRLKRQFVWCGPCSDS